MTAHTILEYSNRIIYKTLDHNFLFQAAEEDSVIIQIDGDLTSVCSGDCHYEIEGEDNLPLIQEMQLEDNGKFINFTLLGEAATYPTSSINGHDISDFRVYDE